MRLLRRKTKSFEIQVQDLVLRITADDDFAEESRAAALSFWEQLQSYALQHPEFRTSKRPPEPAGGRGSAIVQEMVASASPPEWGRCSRSAGRWWTRSDGSSSSP